MGFRFRKRVKLFPGLWLNVSKGGMSTSVGTKGLTVNLKGDKTRTTVSAPGTGISYSESTRSTERPGEARPGRAFVLVLLVLAVLALFLFVR
jgi:Protein of unknown function (DUF4236)